MKKFSLILVSLSIVMSFYAQSPSSSTRINQGNRIHQFITVNGDITNNRGNCVPSPYLSSDPIYIQVIDLDPYCCDVEWDGICQDLYDALSNAPDCVPSPYSIFDDFYLQTIQIDPSCCEIEWTALCEAIYDSLINVIPACVPSPYASDDPIYLQVISQDPFCCEIFWDDLCQDQYNELAGPDPSNCVPSPYPSNDPFYLQVIAAQPLCCLIQWSSMCQTMYDNLTSGSNECVPSPYASNDPFYITVITANPSCCEVAWTESCQNAYNAAAGVGIAGFHIESFVISPNPSNGNFTITLSQSTFSAASIQIFDLSGKIVYERILLNSDSIIELELNDLNAGMYHATIISNAGQLTQKLLITK